MSSSSGRSTITELSGGGAGGCNFVAAPEGFSVPAGKLMWYKQVLQEIYTA